MNVNSRVDRPRTYRSTQFALTLLSDVPLSQRLLAELSFFISRFKQRWPDFKEDPVAVIKIEARHLGQVLKHAFSRPQVAAGLVTSIMVVMSVTLIVAVLDQRAVNRDQEDERDDLEVVTTINFPESPDNKSDPGIGAGEKGRVGFERGRGEGSRPEAARSRGGGGGGTHAQLPSSQGRMPAPSHDPGADSHGGGAAAAGSAGCRHRSRSCVMAKARLLVVRRSAVEIDDAFEWLG